MKITDKNFLEETKKQVEPLMMAFENGKSARDIAKDIYMTLPNKSEDTAYMIVDEMIEIIENYHDEYDTCYANDDSYVRGKLLDATKGMDDAVERCKVYHRILVALAAHAIYVDGEANAETRAKAYADEHKEFECTSEEAVEKEAELFELTVEALKTADIMTMQFPEILDRLKDSGLDKASYSFAFGRDSADLKLILAMQTYVNAQNGMYEEINEEISMKQIAYNVCGAADTYALAVSAEEGTADKSVLVKALSVIGKVIGVVALVCLAFAPKLLVDIGIIIWAVFSIAFFILLALLVLVLPAAVSVALLIGAGYLIVCGAGAAYKGLKKLVIWSKPYVKVAVQWLKEKVCTLLNYISAKIDKRIEEHKNEIADNPVIAEAPANRAVEEEQTESNTVFA